MSNSEVVVNCIKRRKGNLIKVLGGKCCLCGFDDFQEALEFHHVNPAEKSFGIMDSKHVTASLEDQLNELKKCVLVCANCHRGIHQGYYQVPENYQDYYDDNIAKQLVATKYGAKAGVIRYCQYCGKEFEVSYKERDQKFCSPECAKKSLQRTERPSREELKTLIRNEPFTVLGRKFGVSDKAIAKWCISYNLPSKKTEIVKYSDEEWEKI